jgi:benzoyl-CoA reductase/2-hydroxyglutaryl-CoA dehydratase subunit BcrC/BadD/HgdB
LRHKLVEVDLLTWREGVVSGGENDTFLTSASDFEGNVELFERKVDEFLAQAKRRKPISADARIGYIGVPPIWNDLYEFIESQGAHVVFNEMQRQFSMPFEFPDIVDRYIAYTYPYGVFPRLADIETAISERAVDGLIHYTQSFCFRQIEDLIFRKKLPLPILTLEGDQPCPLDGRTKLRISAFIEMLRKRRTNCSATLPVQERRLPSNAGKDL